MSAVCRTATIAAPPEAIWAVLADFGAISTWAPKVDHSSLLRSTDGGSGIGTTRRIQTGRMTLLERVVAWDEPTTLAYDLDGLPSVVHSARNEWRLEPAGAGTTAVTLTSFIDCGSRPPQKLVARIVGWRMAKASDSMLAGLTDLLEERSRG
jgi:hypothetical protein